MKNIVVFGGGTGMSQLLRGLKLFPLNVTAVVCVSDSGSSTGILREIYDIPAVGDISKVLLNVSNMDEDLKDLLNYRIKSSNGCEFNHSIKNLILTALIDLKGSLSEAVIEFSKIFNIDGTVLPLTEDNVNLMALTADGETIVGEANITEAKKTIASIWYDKEFKVNDKVIKAIKNADCIIFPPGSLFTSILPHLMVPDVVDAINESKAKKLYVCNLVTQPGETTNFTVSDHLKIISKALRDKNVDTVIANKAKISKTISNKYQTAEQKLPVVYDVDEIIKLGVKQIADNLYVIENNIIRHDYLKTAYLVYSYLMGDK